jgi:hypothetical protein
MVGDLNIGDCRLLIGDCNSPFGKQSAVSINQQSEISSQHFL